MKKNIYITLAAVSVLLGLSSCGTTYVSVEPDANKAWVGKPHSEIVKTYGAPDRETEDGLGGKILIYEEGRVVETGVANSAPTYGPHFGGLYGFYYHMNEPVNTSYTSEKTLEVDYAHFFIDPNGVCYQVKTNLTRPKTKEELAKEDKDDDDD